jgi:acylphosphatase
VKTVRVTVSGLVQGVFFRASTQRRAAALGLAGWVRNTPDGRVEVMAQGPPDKVDALLRWLWIGPSSARVLDVDVIEADEEPGLRGFRVR